MPAPWSNAALEKINMCVFGILIYALIKVEFIFVGGGILQVRGGGLIC